MRKAETLGILAAMVFVVSGLAIARSDNVETLKLPVAAQENQVQLSLNTKKTNDETASSGGDLQIKVQSAFDADLKMSETEIDIQVENDSVKLMGLVGSEADKKHAEDLASEIQGVRAVENNLKVK